MPCQRISTQKVRVSKITLPTNTKTPVDITIDLQGGTELVNVITQLQTDIPGLCWYPVKHAQPLIYDATFIGYIPVSDDMVEDVWLKSDDLDKFTGLLREFDPDKLASLPGSQLRDTVVYTMAKSLELVIRKPLYEDTGEPIREYLQRKGGLPIDDSSPLFSYSIDDLADEQSVPDCELIRLVSWINSVKQILNILYHGDLRPLYRLGYAGECPSGEHIPFIDGDVQPIPLGKSPDMRYDHSFQKARIYWIPKAFLP